MTSLQHKSDTLDEEISVYGIEDDSRYVKISDLSALKGNEAYISASYADKYSLSVGDTVVLDEKYENKQYEFEVAGIYDHSQTLAVFLSNEQYCEIFDMDSDAFTGYLSDSEITDIDEDEIATVITEHDITKMCDQLDHSMGNYMTYFQYLCILLSIVMIYLLTKLIIEKNENAISMTKILGYENKEIASLYLLSTTIMVVIEDAVSVVLGAFVMNLAWKAILFSYSGWFAFVIQPAGYVKMFAFVLIGYLFVMILDFMRIKKIPMDQALKNVE
jgi:putative ABC transport system permease protein